jgi:hypothetical protein
MWILIVGNAKQHEIRKLQISNATAGFEESVISLGLREAKRMGFSNVTISAGFEPLESMDCI